MNRKVCTKCKDEKDEEFFFFKNKVKNIRRTYCNECEKESKNAYYKKNSERISINIVKAKKERVRIAQEFVVEYLKTHPCVDCTESDIIVLDFDHLSDKKKSVSTMVCDGLALETIKKEIDKCEVRCANCHRRKTSKQFGYYKSLLSSTGRAKVSKTCVCQFEDDSGH